MKKHDNIFFFDIFENANAIVSFQQSQIPTASPHFNPDLRVAKAAL
jgi:hypothetical protein